MLDSLDLAPLQAAAGAVYWQRGEAYHQQGRVRLLKLLHDGVHAEVLGSTVYRVYLRYKPGHYRDGVPAPYTTRCDCPLGDDGACCKHIVATALRWAAVLQGEEPQPQTLQARRRRPRKADPAARAALADFVAAQSANALAARMLALSDQIPDVQQTLLQWMRRSQAAAANGTRQVIDALLGLPGAHGTRGSARAAAAPAELPALLREQVQSHPAEALTDCHYALHRLLAMSARTDSSDSALHTCLRELRAVHLEACMAAQPEPGLLAAQVLQLQQLDEHDRLPISAYAEVLGERGLEAYEALLRRQLSAPGAATAPPPSCHSPARRLQALLALQGRVDDWIALHQADLRTAERYLEIVAFCLQQQREDAALKWAELGSLAYPHSDKLRRRYAECLARDGMNDDAIDEMLGAFKQNPTGDNLVALRAIGGRRRWPELRMIAYRHVNHFERKIHIKGQPPNYEMRIRLLLAEGCIQDALLIAEQGYLIPETQVRLADAARENYPQQAGQLYERVIDFRLRTRQPDRATTHELIGRRLALLTEDAGWLYARELHQKYPQRRSLHDWLAAQGWADSRPYRRRRTPKS